MCPAFVVHFSLLVSQYPVDFAGIRRCPLPPQGPPSDARPEDRVRVSQAFLGRRQLHIVTVELGEVGVGMGDATQRHILEGVVYRRAEDVGGEDLANGRNS